MTYEQNEKRQSRKLWQLARKTGIVLGIIVSVVQLVKSFL